MTSAEEVVRRLFAQQFATMQRQMQSRETAMRQEAGRIATGTVSSATITLDQLAQGGATASQVLAWNSGTGEWEPATNTPSLPWTTAGDIVYYDGSAAQRLAIGTAGQALVVNAGATAPEWDTVLTNPMTTAEDIIVGGAAGAPTRLGVGSNGQVLTVSGGAVGWGSGGGSGTQVQTYDPNLVPASPDSRDDDFSGSSLDVKWTWINQGTATATVARYALLLSVAATGSNNIRYIYQAPAAGDFTVATRQTVLVANAATRFFAGLIVADSSGQFESFTLFYDEANDEITLLLDRYTDTTTFSSTVASVPMNSGGIAYLRCSYDSGTPTLTYSFSLDGHHYLEVASHSATAFLSGVNRVGLGTGGRGSGTLAASYHWFRYYTTADRVPGEDAYLTRV